MGGKTERATGRRACEDSLDGETEAPKPSAKLPKMQQRRGGAVVSFYKLTVWGLKAIDFFG